MTCVHKVRWSVKRPENCRFRLSVSHYKDRIISPNPYEGDTVITPSDERQTLPTRGKTVATDITVLPAPTETLSTTENGQFTPSEGNVGFSEVVVDVPPTVPTLQSKSVNPSETAQVVTADSGYDGLSAVDVGAIPSSYVGSGITRRTASDLTASGGTVSVPSGYYAESGSKSVQSGTEGTPTASKGTVSNHSIAVTPSVSNTEGYISGGTLTGNAVSVSASELVSGTENITQNGTYDVTNKASVVVNVPTGGGGGLMLIDTIEINGVRSVQTDIDASWFDDYDYVLLVPELTFSASDWLYVIADATSGGNAYADKRTSAVPSQAVFISRAVGTISGTWLNGRQAAGYISPSYLYWYLYYASTTMTGTIKIYGIKVTA